jgi:enoyl-CoA hydratase/carnithine racemase
MSIVTYEKDGAVGVVTLAKPPHNLIDEAFSRCIARSLRQCRS